MSNLLGSTEAIKHSGKLFAPAVGARIAMINPLDVGAAAAVALIEDGHEGRAYTLTGPKAITYDEIAGHLSMVIGQKIEFVGVSDEAARRSFLESGMPDWLAEQLVAMFGILRQGAAAQISDQVRALTGREPRSFAKFARDHAGLFRS